MITLQQGSYSGCCRWDEEAVALDLVNLDPDTAGKITFINTTGQQWRYFQPTMSLQAPVKFLGFVGRIPCSIMVSRTL